MRTINNANTPGGVASLQTTDLDPPPISVTSTTAPLTVRMPGGLAGSGRLEVSAAPGFPVTISGYISPSPKRSFDRPIDGGDIVVNGDMSVNLALGLAQDGTYKWLRV